MEKYKVHFVARGLSQKGGIDHDICTCFQIYDHPLDHSPCGFTRWNLHQMDVKIAFLHGSIKEEVYVEQPEGFEIYD